VHDQRARAALDELTDRLRTAPDTIALAATPIVIQRRDRRPVIARVLPVDGAARNPFVGARALLVLSDLERSVVPDATVMARIFRLSPAEARIAMRIAGGVSLREAADELSIAHETARHQLKAVFAKTGTNRQSQLVALLARLPRPASPD
jgi:DNA-binding CsgD family transcriptional regulator